MTNTQQCELTNCDANVSDETHRDIARCYVKDLWSDVVNGHV